MRLRILLSAVMFSFLLPAALHAQDFGVMESAETIDRGNFKFKVNPVVVFGRNGEAWELEDHFTASFAEEGDSFGRSVAISGNIALVGSPGLTHGTAHGTAHVFSTVPEPMSLALLSSGLSSER